jgi:hypothetical protein
LLAGCAYVAEAAATESKSLQQQQQHICNPSAWAAAAAVSHCVPVAAIQVVAALRALSESGKVWAVRGNNDDVALAAWYKLQAGVPLGSLKKKTRWVGQLLPEDVAYMNQLPFSIRVEG